MAPELTNTKRNRRAQPNGSEPSLPTLIGGALDDVQDLLVQQFEYFREEIVVDLEKTKEAGFSLGLVGVFGLVGGLFALPALVGLLAWWIPEVPWWGWSGILAGLCLGMSTLLYIDAFSRLKAFSLWPQRSLRAVKENFKWIRNRMTSSTTK